MNTRNDHSDTRPPAVNTLSRLTSLPRQSAHFVSGRVLLQVALLVLVGMFLYELTKEIFFPWITKWESHFITILVSTFIATLGIYLALKAIGRAQMRYRLLADNALDLISTYSPEGIVRYASPASRSLLGHDPAELVGSPALDFVHPDDLPVVRRFHTDLLTRLEVNAVIYRLRHQDGRYIWFESSGKSVRDEKSDEVQELVIVSRDIMARKQAEDTLQHYARRLSILNNLDRVLLASEAIDPAVDACLRRIRQLIPYDRATLTVYNPESQVVDVHAVDTNHDLPIPEKQTLPLEDFPPAEQLPAEGLHHIQDTAALKKYAGIRHLIGLGMESFISVPLVVEDTIIGVLVVSFAKMPENTIDREVLDTVRQFADHFAVAVRQERLREQVEQYTHELEARVAERTAQLTAANERLRELGGLHPS